MHIYGAGFLPRRFHSDMDTLKGGKYTEMSYLCLTMSQSLHFVHTIALSVVLVVLLVY